MASENEKILILKRLERKFDFICGTIIGLFNTGLFLYVHNIIESKEGLYYEIVSWVLPIIWLISTAYLVAKYRECNEHE